MKNCEGSVLLQALIFTFIISILAAGVMRLNLDMFIFSSGNVVEGAINQAEGKSIMNQVLADMGVCDPSGLTGGCAGTATYPVIYSRRRGGMSSVETVTRNIQVQFAWDAANSFYTVSIEPQ